MYNNNTKIGLLGGGQLGRMLLQAAVDLDLNIKILDPDPQAPCAGMSNQFVQGSFQDYDTVYNFGKNCDLLTIEIENVNLQALNQLEADGVQVYPQPKVLEIIKDKRLQKQFYTQHNIPTAPYILVQNRAEIAENTDFLPAFNKLGVGGYDGNGTQRISSAEQLHKAFDAPGLLEKPIDFEKELAVIVARNPNGQVCTYPTVEMVFHPEQNLVEYLFAPAQIDQNTDTQAQNLAKIVAEKLGIVGLLAVEMFLDKNGKIWVNEVAPRTHNSGHHTIRANRTSQFEQQWRAILNLPLGSTAAQGPAAMLNILGAPNHNGPAIYHGIEQALELEGVHPFLYGKKTTKPFRKMGHVTITGSSLADVEAKVAKVKNLIQVKA
jgi:5-(carboxyamino)imidazole ribonucleotide synthase